MSEYEQKEHEDQDDDVEAHKKHQGNLRNDSEPKSKEDASDDVEAHMKNHKNN
jgi:hypothetical protein